MQKRPFRKGYLGDWSHEIFEIKSRLPTVPVTYEPTDLAGESIKGRFYNQELQKVTKSDENTSISIAYSGRGSAATVAKNISFRGKITRRNLIRGCRISSVSEKMSRFTLTLPSNSSMNYYEDNTVAQFTTKLAQTRIGRRLGSRSVGYRRAGRSRERHRERVLL